MTDAARLFPLPSQAVSNRRRPTRKVTCMTLPVQVIEMEDLAPGAYHRNGPTTAIGLDRRARADEEAAWLAAHPEVDPSTIPRGKTPSDETRDEWMNEAKAEVVAYRILGLRASEIAEKTGLKVMTVHRYLAEARKNAKLDDLEDLLDFQAVGMAVDVVLDKLEGGNLDAALETLKGRGKFRTRHSDDPVAVRSMTLSVNVTLPPGVQAGATVEGQIVGVPRETLALPAGEEPDHESSRLA